MNCRRLLDPQCHQKTGGRVGIIPGDQRLDFFKMRQLRERRTTGQQDHSFDAGHIQGPLPQFRAKVVTEHLTS